MCLVIETQFHLGQTSVEVVVTIIFFFPSHLKMLKSFTILSELVIGLSTIPVELSQFRLPIVRVDVLVVIYLILDQLHAIFLKLDGNAKVHESLHEVSLGHQALATVVEDVLVFCNALQ